MRDERTTIVEENVRKMICKVGHGGETFELTLHPNRRMRGNSCRLCGRRYVSFQDPPAWRDDSERCA